MPTFYVDDDGYLYVEYKKDGAYTDPVSVTVDAYAPDGTKKVDSQSMTKSATGKYYYYVDLDTAGMWTFYIKATDVGGHVQTDRYTHMVSAKRTGVA